MTGERDDESGRRAETRQVIHDLRQPLAALQMWVDLLAEKLQGQLGEREERYLAKIRSEAARMADLLARAGVGKDVAEPPREPPAPRARGVLPAVGGAPLAGRSLLVVEDDPVTAEALQLALEGEGARVLLADSVTTALASYADDPPHGVLSDLRLADGDGFALVAEIRRRDAASGRTTAVLAVTGFDSAETRSASRAAGFDDLVVKPFALADLIDRVARLLAVAP